MVKSLAQNRAGRARYSRIGIRGPTRRAMTGIDERARKPGL